MDTTTQRVTAGRFRILATVVLSLFPGLGHIYARVWGLGVLLVTLNLLWSIGMLQFTTWLPPTAHTVALFLGIVALSLLAALVIMIDAVRRTRTALTRPRPRWFKSTWFTAAVALGVTMLPLPPDDYGWRSFSIPSGSMIPALEVGDYMLVSTAVPFEALRRGDVIVFSLPANPEIDYVKRLIGLPGDRIAMQDGTVVLNGRPLPLRSAGQMLAVDHEDRVLSQRLVETLPDGRAYPVLKQTSLGPANTMAEVTVAADHMFVMGDNRDNSADSRFPRQLGQVPRANLIGRAGMFYWSNDRGRIMTAVE